MIHSNRMRYATTSADQYCSYSSRVVYQVITMHGHARTPEIPVYGAKVIAVREGRLDLHGSHHTTSWTMLAFTAPSTSTTITVLDDVSDWPIGAQIVIAPTGFIRVEAEQLTVVAVTSHTITFEPALSFSHLGETRIVAGRELEYRAEVGLLSRNVIIQGDGCSHMCVAVAQTADCSCTEGVTIPEMFGALAQLLCCVTLPVMLSHTMHLFSLCSLFPDAASWALDLRNCLVICPTKHYSARCCTGAHIMLHSEGDESLIGRLENIEMRNVGQAYRLGRYPIHFHMIGTVYNSYVRNVSVHHTFNRAITIHGVHHLDVSHNVAYHTMGHTFFIEDGMAVP